MARSTHKSSPNAIEMLMEDHDKVKKMFRQFEKAHEQEDDETCRELAETICAELKMHTALEEELFYPAAREAVADQHLLDEAEIEHESAKHLIAKMESLDVSDPHYAATMTVLGEYVKHHIKEEESEMFPQAKKGKMDLAGLATELMKRKEQLSAEMGIPMEGADEGESEGSASRPQARKSQRQGAHARR